MIFNYLIGNADAHGKNISLLLTREGPHLAPFYDLMCTAIYPELTDRLAMKIGGEDRPDWVIERRWQTFSKEIGIAYKLVRQRLVYLKEAVLDAAMQLMHEEHIKNNPCEVYDRIIAIIRRRSTKITNSLNTAQDEATAQ